MAQWSSSNFEVDAIIADRGPRTCQVRYTVYEQRDAVSLPSSTTKKVDDVKLIEYVREPALVIATSTASEENAGVRSEFSKVLQQNRRWVPLLAVLRHSIKFQ